MEKLFYYKNYYLSVLNVKSQITILNIIVTIFTPLTTATASLLPIIKIYL